MRCTTTGLGTACHPAHGKPLYDVVITSSHLFVFVFVTSFVYSFVHLRQKLALYITLTIALFFFTSSSLFFLLLFPTVTYFQKNFMLHCTHLISFQNHPQTVKDDLGIGCKATNSPHTHKNTKECFPCTLYLTQR